MSDARTATGSAGFTSFGALLRYLRRRQRLTQQDLAIATGYSIAQISRLEQNQRLPNPDAIRALFVPALGLSDSAPLAIQLLELADAARTPDTPPDLPPDVPLDPPVADDAPLPAAAPAMPLLVTKLYRPRPRSDRVARARLFARLDTALEHQLTLVAAPAGFGKTTLLAQWAHDSDQRADAGRGDPGPSRRSAWLTLDAADNDAVTFVRYLIAALQTAVPALGQSTLELLGAPWRPSPDVLLRLLLNDLAALPHDAVLILDDFHLLAEPTIHGLIGTLLEHLPPALHLVIATRATPPLPLARLRARAQLVELSAGDLRFTPDETAQLLRDTLGLQLAVDDVAALQSRTEGWIAGLQLAALALAEHAQPSRVIDAFSGSNRLVLDYLVSEVLDGQPAHIQSFLLQTAVLERLCGPLCDAVMGFVPPELGAADVARQPAAYTQVLLEELDRANLFLIPLDAERRWYRYHQLFAEVLRARLQSGAAGATVVELHRRAGGWLVAQGLIAEAMPHILATQEWERAAALIEQYGGDMAQRGQVTAVLGWLGQLPECEIRSRPRLALIAAQVLTLTNQLAAAEERLRAVDEVYRSETGPEAQLIQGYTAAVRADMMRVSGDFVQGVALARRALALLPAHETATRARVRSLIVLDCFTTGDMTDSTRQLAEAVVAEAQAAGSALTYHHALSDLGWIRMFQGHLQAAAAIFGQAQRVAETAELGALTTSAYALLGQGDVLREWGRLEAADAVLTRGLTLAAAQTPINPYAYLVGAVVLARVRQARGDHAGAVAVLDEFAMHAQHAGVDVAQLATIAAVRAQLQLAEGHLAAAVHWAAHSGLSARDTVSFPRENEYLTLARVWIARGRQDPEGTWLGDAHVVLAKLLEDAERGARVGSAVEALVLLALAYGAQGNGGAAHTTLRRALALGAPAGFQQMFVAEGAPLQRLLAALKDQPPPVADPAHLERLVAAF